MKNFLYSVYAFFFNISRKLFKLKNNRVAFVSMHNENFNDSLGCIYKELQKNENYEFVFITRQDLMANAKNIFRVFSFFFKKSRLLACSKYVFLNDNFMPMSKLTFNKDAVVVQLWHAEGAFKKFGLSIPQPEQLRKAEISANSKLTYAVCSSKGVRKIYADAFGLKEEQVLPLGAARTDYFFADGNKEKAREKLEKLYPTLKNKKLILYAPTFRDDPEKNKKLLSSFDFFAFTERFNDEYALLLRLHPQIHDNIKDIQGIINVTDYDDVRELVLCCDILITDYSSICMDFSLLSKKTVFYAFDLSDYTADRNFYFDYESYVPGPVAANMEELFKAIEEPFDKEKNDKFRMFNFDYCDGNNAKRIIEEIIK